MVKIYQTFDKPIVNSYLQTTATFGQSCRSYFSAFQVSEMTLILIFLRIACSQAEIGDTLRPKMYL